MSSNVICPFCSQATPSEYNFCTVCERQIKCLDPSCNKMLIPGKTKCFGCGQTLSITANRSSTQLNKYVRDVKQVGKHYEEHIELSVTDHAVSELAPFIGAEIMPRPSQRLYPAPRQNSSTIPTRQTVPTNEIFAESQALPQLTANTSDEVQETQTANADDYLSPYFEADGEFLIATVKDFRGKTGAEQQRHFILLYTDAHNRSFRKPVPSKEHFKNAAQKVGFLDHTNFPKYLKEQARKYLIETGSGYKLNHDGDKEVKRIITLMKDENAEGGYEYWKRNASSGTKRPRLSTDNKDQLKDWMLQDILPSHPMIDDLIYRCG